MADALPEPLRAGWKQTVAAGPPPASEWSLTRAECIAANAGWCDLPTEAVQDMQAFARKVESNHTMSLIAHHLHTKIYPAAAEPAEPAGSNKQCAMHPNPHLVRLHNELVARANLASPRHLPALAWLPQGHFPKVINNFSGSETAMLYLLLYLDGVPGLVLQHQQRGIPEDVTRSTLSDIGIWARAYKTNGLSPVHLRSSSAEASSTSSWGLSNLSWPMLSLTGQILRIGRLQHKSGRFDAPFTAYRHQVTGAVTMVAAEPGIGFDDKGLRVQKGHEPAWVSVHDQQNTILVATKISPTGMAERDTVALDLREWRVALQQHDPILEIHIPEGGSMDMDACREGLQRTVREYSSWSPGQEAWMGFTCSSWMLDPHYAELLPPTSNIVRLQREM